MQPQTKRYYPVKYGYESGLCQFDVPKCSGMESHVYERHSMPNYSVWQTTCR